MFFALAPWKGVKMAFFCYRSKYTLKELELEWVLKKTWARVCVSALTMYAYLILYYIDYSPFRLFQIWLLFPSSFNFTLLLPSFCLLCSSFHFISIESFLYAILNSNICTWTTSTAFLSVFIWILLSRPFPLFSFALSC